MALRLIEGEQIVRSYDYAHSKSSAKGNSNSNITVTNKRIVFSEESSIFLSREEIPLHKVRSFRGNFRKKSIALWVILAVTAAIFSIACISSMSSILAGAGILLVVLCIIRAVQDNRIAYLDLDFNFYPLTLGDELSYSLYTSSAPSKKNGFLSKLFAKSKGRIYVDKATARTIVDEINGVLMELNNQ